jgi:hypothetical protein
VLDLDVDWDACADVLTPEAVDLLLRLLHPDPAARLGAGGAHEIKQHAFFAGSQGGLPGVDWGALEAMRVTPPVVPAPHTVHAKSMEQVGAFNEAKYRQVRLEAEDEAVFAKWGWEHRGRQERDLAGVLDLLVVDDGEEQAKGCCGVM